MSWKKTLAAFAPTAAKLVAAANPLAGAAIGVIAKVLNVNPDETSVETAIKNASPETLLKLKTAEIELTKFLRDADIKEAQVEIDDRASARHREIAIKDNTPRNLAYIYTLGFFSTLGVQFYIVIQGIKVDPIALRMIDTSTGVLFAMMLASKDYFLGTSAGSKLKTVMSMFKKGE